MTTINRTTASHLAVTEGQRDRLRDLGAHCPMMTQPGDDQLVALGLAQIDADGVWPAYDAQGVLYYDDHGCFTPRVIRDEVAS